MIKNINSWNMISGSFLGMLPTGLFLAAVPLINLIPITLMATFIVAGILFLTSGYEMPEFSALRFFPSVAVAPLLGMIYSVGLIYAFIFLAAGIGLGALVWAPRKGINNSVLRGLCGKLEDPTELWEKTQFIMKGECHDAYECATEEGRILLAPTTKNQVKIMDPVLDLNRFERQKLYSSLQVARENILNRRLGFLPTLEELTPEKLSA